MTRTIHNGSAAVGRWILETTSWPIGDPEGVKSAKATSYLSRYRTLALASAEISKRAAAKEESEAATGRKIYMDIRDALTGSITYKRAHLR